MRYVLLGHLDTEWVSRNNERVERAKAKLGQLGIKLEGVWYTQGAYDFVDIIDAPDAEAVLAFSVWYASQEFGRIQSMPAFDSATFERAIGKV